MIAAGRGAPVQRAAVFVDRDGVINELVPDPVDGRPESPLRVSDVALIEGAARALQTLASAGFLLVGVTNQPAAAKGRIELAELEAIQQRVIELLAGAGIELDAFKLCPHHPDGVMTGLSGECACRKPAPGMLLEAAAELGIDLACSWMVGDTDADVLAGRAAGCRTALIETAASAHKRHGGARADLVAASLADAAAFILPRDLLS